MPRAPPSTRPSRREGWALAALFLFALALRLALWDVHAYGDEAAHYYVARHLGQGPDHVESVNFDFPAEKAPFLANLDLRPIFWQRPLFSLLLAPGALVSFEAYRFLHATLTSLLPVAAALTLRTLGARALPAYAAGLAVAAHTTFVTWGALAFPDSLMTLALALAVWTRSLQRPRLSAGLALAAVWTKEVAFIALLFFLLGELFVARRQDAQRRWRLNAYSTSYLAVTAIALWPLLYSQFLGGLFPGWGRGGELTSNLERFFVQLWLLPVILLGLRWARTRWLTSLALLYPAFFLAYRLAFGRGLALWHLPLMQYFALAAAALVLDEWWTRTRAHARASWAPAAVALLLVGALTGQILVPETYEPRTRLTMPLTGSSDMSLPESLRFQHERDHELHLALSATPPPPWSRVFLVDVGWFYIAHPISERADAVHYGYTDVAQAAHQEPELWAQHVENASAYTLVFVTASPLNQAVRSVYADCRAYENAQYQVILGSGCPGRAAGLRAEYERLRAD